MPSPSASAELQSGENRCMHAIINDRPLVGHRCCFCYRYQPRLLPALVPTKTDISLRVAPCGLHTSSLRLSIGPPEGRLGDRLYLSSRFMHFLSNKYICGINADGTARRQTHKTTRYVAYTATLHPTSIPQAGDLLRLSGT